MVIPLIDFIIIIIAHTIILLGVMIVLKIIGVANDK
jgi:hypothetical protein